MEDTELSNNELWEKYKRFCYGQIKKYRGTPYYEDLENECYLAVVDTREHYETDKSSFMNLLAIYIKKRVIEYSAKCERVYIPRNLLTYVNRYKNRELPTVQQIMKECGLNEPAAHNVLTALEWQIATSLNKAVKDEDIEAERGDLVPDPMANVEDEAVERVQREQLSRAMDKELERLTEEQQTVIRKQYYDNKSFPEIAEEQGKTVRAVSSVSQRAIRTLRKPETMKRLRPFCFGNEGYIYSHGLRSGYGGTSSTEWTAIQMIEGWQTDNGTE